MIKVNVEELQVQIKKLKQAATEQVAKAGGKRSGPAVRQARKKVKRAQRKLRLVKSYKTGGKKASEAKPADEKASA